MKPEQRARHDSSSSPAMSPAHSTPWRFIIFRYCTCAYRFVHGHMPGVLDKSYFDFRTSEHVARLDRGLCTLLLSSITIWRSARCARVCVARSTWGGRSNHRTSLHGHTGLLVRMYL